MWIMIAGPYRHGSSDEKIWQNNLTILNEYAYEVHQMGHVPIIGANVVLPIIEAKGYNKYDKLMMPICLKLAERCDAVLRVGGPSNGADMEVEKFSSKGLPVYYKLENIPEAT